MQNSTLAFVIFLLIVIGIYVAAHSYIYYRMRTSLEFGKITNLAIGLFFIIMIFSPFIIRISENKGLKLLSVFFSYTGYMWMGIISIMIFTLIFLDILNIIIVKVSIYLGIKSNFLYHTNKYTFLLSVILSLLAASIGYFDAKNIRTTKVKLESRYLPENISKLHIVHLSDIHISQTIGSDFISQIVSKTVELKPDLILITGDITDIDPRKNKKIISLLNSLNPPLGKFAVTGNHEFYAGIEMVMNFYQACNIKLIRGETINISESIIIAGVDDDNGSRFSNFADISEDKLLTPIDENKFVILLKHKPFINDAVKNKVDIQLSGHTHGGQIFPFSLIVKQIYKYFYGLYRISDRMHLYVSRGTGYWGPPIRFLAPPEITSIEITRKE